LKDLVLLMGFHAEQMVADSIRALMENRSQLAEEVILRDETLDELELEVDTFCKEILALHHPVAGDLRFVVTAFKIVRDLERIGGLAVNIARRVLENLQEPPCTSLPIVLPIMAESARSIVAHSMDAFVNREESLAEQVINDDRKIDDMNEQIFRELLGFMIEDSQVVPGTLRLLLIAKHLERIGDHATNIAQMVLFMIRGSEPRRCLPSSV
jgi:phosphate transport system protein